MALSMAYVDFSIFIQFYQHRTRQHSFKIDLNNQTCVCVCCCSSHHFILSWDAVCVCVWESYKEGNGKIEMHDDKNHTSDFFFFRTGNFFLLLAWKFVSVDLWTDFWMTRAFMLGEFPWRKSQNWSFTFFTVSVWQLWMVLPPARPRCLAGSILYNWRPSVVQKYIIVVRCIWSSYNYMEALYVLTSVHWTLRVRRFLALSAPIDSIASVQCCLFCM